MSNRRDNEPSLDYFELRRRHEEYKNSQRLAKEQPEAKAEAPESAGQPEAEARVQAAVDIAEDIAPEADAAGILPDEDYDEAYPEDEDGAEADVNPNPFDSFISAFHGLRDRFGKRAARRRDEDEDYDEIDELIDEYAAEDGDLPEAGGEDWPEAPVAAERPEEAPAGEALDVEDVFEEAPARPARDDADLPEDDGDYEYPEDEEERPEEISGFKKFLRLFVVPVDEDETASDDAGDDDEWDEDEENWNGDSEAPAGDEWDADARPAEEQPVSDAAADDIEGGLDMSDQNRVTAELANQLAADLEAPGLSRRERRELALRQAAEQAAAEQAQAVETVAEAAEQPVEPLFDEKPLEADSIDDVAEGIVDIAPVQDAAEAVVDEPTREFKPVSKMNFDPFLEEDAPEAEAEPGDEPDEEEEEEEKPRRGLFGRRKRADEEDEDDEDDDEDEDDEDEDVKPRRGLFGRRAKYDDEDDEEEDDEDEEDEKPSRRGRRDRYDEDEDDYDDDYDDDDEDDYDDYDDDDYDDEEEDDGASFGHVLLGILKGFLTAVMLLLFVVVALNVLNIFNVISLDNLAGRLPTKMADVFLPSQSMKQQINVEANANPAPVVAEEAQPEAPVEEPQAESEAAPVEETAPETEAEPVEEDAGTTAVG